MPNRNKKNMRNEERYLIKILRDISNKHIIKLTSLSFDWIFCLSKNEVNKFVFGYNFEINSSVSKMIAQDKSATSEILKKEKIPVVPHKLFLSPSLDKYVSNQGNWIEIIKFYYENNEQIVCKPVNGSSGNGVYLCKTILSLEKNVQRLFSRNRSICLSPYLKIKREYRTIVLDENVEYVYLKEIPFIIGDGAKDIITLTREKYGNDIMSFMDYIQELDMDINNIPKADDYISLNWKNNLGKGAKPIIIEKESDIIKKLKVAIISAKAINIRFASVDLIETINGDLFVLEINSGVMTEYLLKELPKEYDNIKKIYEKAILKMYN